MEGIICPKCGHKNIIESNETQSEIEGGKADNSEITQKTYLYYCNKCKKHFGLTFHYKIYDVNKIIYTCYDLLSATNEIFKFEIIDNYILFSNKLYVIDSEQIINEYKLSNQEWNEILDNLFSAYFLDWEDEYIDTEIDDGGGWKLEVSFNNNESIIKKGFMQYPPYWLQFSNILLKYGYNNDADKYFIFGE